jgi:hypothetical protein
MEATEDGEGELDPSDDALHLDDPETPNEPA